LSKEILLEFDKLLGFKICGMKYANFQVLREIHGICSGVLLELGFLSNIEEAEHSSKKESVLGYAMVIIQVIYQLIDAEYY
tara:strand:- start:19795 stop:20037 length:243 start_codon:yes stop_codon:yes gene_type:complete